MTLHLGDVDKHVVYLTNEELKIILAAMHFCQNRSPAGGMTDGFVQLEKRLADRLAGGENG